MVRALNPGRKEAVWQRAAQCSGGPVKRRSVDARGRACSAASNGFNRRAERRHRRPLRVSTAHAAPTLGFAPPARPGDSPMPKYVDGFVIPIPKKNLTE